MSDKVTIDKRAVRKALTEVTDPELGVNIVDLGFIYGIGIGDGWVKIKMTLTSPLCPLGDSLTEEVKKRVGEIAGVAGVEVELVFNPPWSPEKVSPQARKVLGL